MKEAALQLDCEVALPWSNLATHLAPLRGAAQCVISLAVTVDSSLYENLLIGWKG